MPILASEYVDETLEQATTVSSSLLAHSRSNMPAFFFEIKVGYIIQILHRVFLLFVLAAEGVDQVVGDVEKSWVVPVHGVFSAPEKCKPRLLKVVPGPNIPIVVENGVPASPDRASQPLWLCVELPNNFPASPSNSRERFFL